MVRQRRRAFARTCSCFNPQRLGAAACTARAISPLVFRLLRVASQRQGRAVLGNVTIIPSYYLQCNIYFSFLARHLHLVAKSSHRASTMAASMIKRWTPRHLFSAAVVLCLSCVPSDVVIGLEDASGDDQINCGGNAFVCLFHNDTWPYVALWMVARLPGLRGFPGCLGAPSSHARCALLRVKLLSVLAVSACRPLAK